MKTRTICDQYREGHCRLRDKPAECVSLVARCECPTERTRHEIDKLPESWMGAVIRGRPV